MKRITYSEALLRGEIIPLSKRIEDKCDGHYIQSWHLEDSKHEYLDDVWRYNFTFSKESIGDGSYKIPARIKKI